MPVFVVGTYPAFVKKYLDNIQVDTIDEAIKNYSGTIINFFKSIQEEKLEYRYAAGKWNIKEMLQHIIDAERIFAYRALRIARHDKTPLQGFDENAYATASNADTRSWKNLLLEFEVVRKSSDLLLQSFTEDQLQQTGTTNGEPNNVKAISFVIFGHILHHMLILEEKYL